MLNTKEDIIFSNYLSFTLEVSNKTVHGIINQLIYNNQFKQDIDKSMNLLSERTQKILRLRYGLDDGSPKTLEEVGKIFKVTRERIRQIEAKALRKLRHPSRSKKLKDFLD